MQLKQTYIVTEEVFSTFAQAPVNLELSSELIQTFQAGIEKTLARYLKVHG